MGGQYLNLITPVTQSQLLDVLLSVATVRPVFIWGAPGIGKSSIVEQFAESLNLPCVSLLGSQLAPEDIIGVPKIIGENSVFCPPRMIARDAPYCLFLDELNACSHEVQKSFYSLIHERRVGEYHLHEGSIVIGAGNRAQDSAIVKPMPSALINRMVHVELTASSRDWLAWASENGIHPLILEYIGLRPDHLWRQPPKTEEPFSSPRSWHMLSDAMQNMDWEKEGKMLEIMATGCLTNHHAKQFCAFVQRIRNRYALSAIIDGQQGWPRAPEDRDALYFLAQSFRAQLIKELPKDKNAKGNVAIAQRAKPLLKDLASINFELAQLVVAEDEGGALPEWFIVEMVRDLPRLAEKKGK
jgi:hypothetical protein